MRFVNVIAIAVLSCSAAAQAALSADAEPSTKPQASVVKEDRSSTERFHIAVLSASRKEGPVPDLPPSEAKALADFRKVMTYKSFTIDAETLLQSDRGADARLGLYDVMLAMDSVRKGDVIDVRNFALRVVEPKAYSIIETSFSIKRGETIVLGTSTTDSQARVVLVTALP